MKATLYGKNRETGYPKQEVVSGPQGLLDQIPGLGEWWELPKMTDKRKTDSRLSLHKPPGCPSWPCLTLTTAMMRLTRKQRYYSVHLQGKPYCLKGYITDTTRKSAGLIIWLLYKIKVLVKFKIKLLWRRKWLRCESVCHGTCCSTPGLTDTMASICKPSTLWVRQETGKSAGSLWAG